MEFPGIVSNLVFLALLGAGVYAIIQWRRRSDLPQAVDPGIGTVRRLYFYSVSFVALMMGANGLTQIVQYLLESQFGGEVLHQSQTRLAVGASLTIVGLPLWGLHWRLVQRYVRDLPVERRSLVRKFHVYLVLGVAIGFVVAGYVDILQWAFRAGDFSGFPWGAVVVWSGVWAFHWRLESSEGQPTSETQSVRRLYLYIASLVTLAMLAVGAGRAVHIVLLEGYESLFSVPVVLPGETGLWRPVMRSALAMALVGGATWAVHWLYAARADSGSVLRWVYLYVFAILGGVVTVLVGLGLIIFGLLTWLFGAPVEESAATHFRHLPGALASLSVGAGLWAYHWTVARKEAVAFPQEVQGVQRSYAYIMSALGLGALVVGIGTLVNAAITILSESSRDILAGQELWREPIALSITLGILGAPLWGYYWASVQRRVSAVDPNERFSLDRRIFIFGVLAVGMLALLGSVSTLIFFVLRDLLGDGLVRETLRDARFTIDVIAAAVIFLPYYWMVYRQDRQSEMRAPVAPARAARKEVTVLVNVGGDALVRALETALGYRLAALQWADADASTPDLSEDDLQALARRIGEAVGRNVLLIPDGDGVRVLSYN